jgi:hypothetical protein
MSTYGCGPSRQRGFSTWRAAPAGQASPWPRRTHTSPWTVSIDHDAISAARSSVEQAGVADRVRFSVTNAADLGGAGGYDLVSIFEALHDMSQRGGGPPDPYRLLALLPTAPVRPTRV